ncbi:uncharacterized protein NESG_01676 [Nematocida ausubeli]|uniref:Uncharacterized protein n=1 Tax=Nematocida ausubeli (strain ATCC PRA-371 / ERTm2) TaxID=1913371 RepID=A0A086J0M9_NEMA1|nr:uncharacterized protein NESG_01676 [Nematocida ausubeli]KAI5148641.1 hypothetical protein NEAUS05_1463 [Nematocida ausubeli]KFG25697.1 hypothetical protein NESG_01676 [Nematocida ausubeli]
MKSFYNIAVTEYKALISAYQGSYCVHIISCLLAMGTLYSLMSTSFRKSAETRHFCMVMSNMVYLVALRCGMTGCGLAFTLGGIVSEVGFLLAKYFTKHMQKLFIVSVWFLYTLYIYLLLTRNISTSFPVSIITAGFALYIHMRVYEIYQITHFLCQSVLLTTSFTGVAYLFMQAPSLEYVQHVSTIAICAIFICLLMRKTLTRYTKEMLLK